MLSRRERLPRGFFSSLARAKYRTSAHFTILFPLGKGVAVVISKKVLKRAIDRHTLKRRILAVVKEVPASRLPDAFILYPKKSVLILSPKELREALVELL